MSNNNLNQQMMMNQRSLSSGYTPGGLVGSPNMGTQQSNRGINLGGMNWVQGLAGAKAWNLPLPNQQVVLFDSEDSMFYLKSTNANGMPSLVGFKYEQVDLDNPNNGSTPDMSDYVTYQAIDELIDQKLQYLLAANQQPINDQEDNTKPYTPKKKYYNNRKGGKVNGNGK